MDKIRVVFCGCGHRAFGLSDSMKPIPDFEVIGVCDPYVDKAESLAEQIEKERGLKPAVYSDHIKMLEELKPDAAIVSANWEVHVRISIDAMKRGIAVAMEVGGAYDLDECFELVEAYEKTKAPFFFLENCCFNKEELLATALVRNGLFGEIVYCHGIYGHWLCNEIAHGDIKRHYRLRNYTERCCENYPTHELGPIAKILGINRGNRMLTLSSHASKARGLHEWLEKRNDPELAYLKDVEFKQADIVETMITCENGELINIRLDTTLPRYYDREFTVRGTKGMYTQTNNMVLLDDGTFNDQERLRLPDGSYTARGVSSFDACKRLHNNAENYEEKYLVPMWKEVTEEVLMQGHGGMDYFELLTFADCMKNGKEMPIDVYDAAAWMCITCLSEQSIKNGGAPVEIPDFTKGKYKDRAILDVVELPIYNK
ncbi:MAG: Gfo/Idh/MocA family oxidoreductase [Clostridia bacterium]|nr:Gfo/Idh/MocA family oxidoreductase [Clostridia bacterium]